MGLRWRWFAQILEMAAATTEPAEMAVAADSEHNNDQSDDIDDTKESEPGFAVQAGQQDDLENQVSLFASPLKRKGLQWSTRYFVLRPSRISIYKNEQEYELNNLILLNEIHAIAPVRVKRPFVFAIVTTAKTWYLAAETDELMREWIQQIEAALVRFSTTVREITQEQIAPPEHPMSPASDTHLDEEALQIIQEQEHDKMFYQGYIWRLRTLSKTWKKYWCVIRTRSLVLYKDERVH